MPETHCAFRLLLTPKAKKQLDALPSKYRQQYRKAFERLASQGPTYRSLRTHRYRKKGGEVWGSSASMFLRFYWDYAEERTIWVRGLNSH